MPSTLERLRRLNSLRPVRDATREHRLGSSEIDHSSVDLSEQGQEVCTEAGPCVVLVHAYPVTYSRGDSSLSAVLNRPLDSIARIYPDFNLEYADGFRNAVFLDTETTGLGAGASVYAFMVGLGTFETIPHEDAQSTAQDDARQDFQQEVAEEAPTHFVIRQIFMRNPAEELALLHELADELAGKRMVVTFNGRSFDLPLMRTRMRYNRPFLPESVLQTPLLDRSAAHLDLLLPARRLWRRRLQSCKLAHLEEAILHHERSEADVPGYLIPQLYTDYVRSGDPREMERVFYHNREDIVSMVSLATQLTQAFDLPCEHTRRPALQGQDWLSLGITFEKLKDWAQAEPAYRRALDAAENRNDRGGSFPPSRPSAKASRSLARSGGDVATLADLRTRQKSGTLC